MMRDLALALAMVISTCVGVGGQDKPVYDVRTEVHRLCREGDTVPAFHMAMKSLLHAQRSYGRDDPRTATCLITVADAAKLREKYYLAGLLYRRALSVQEGSLGPSHPDVVHCKRELSHLERNQKHQSLTSGLRSAPGN